MFRFGSLGCGLGFRHKQILRTHLLDYNTPPLFVSATFFHRVVFSPHEFSEILEATCLIVFFSEFFHFWVTFPSCWVTLFTRLTYRCTGFRLRFTAPKQSNPFKIGNCSKNISEIVMVSIWRHFFFSENTCWVCWFHRTQPYQYGLASALQGKQSRHLARGLTECLEPAKVVEKTGSQRPHQKLGKVLLFGTQNNPSCTEYTHLIAFCSKSPKLNYCWWFTNPKQPPGKYRKTSKK